MTPILLAVDDATQVAEARRRAAALAQPLGFDEGRQGTLALAVTEVATNLLKHAGHGTIALRAIAAGRVSGLEVMAVDRGPGIPNLAASLRDGHSTAGSPGLGLGSLMRMTTDFEIYSEPEKGTVLRFEVWSGTPPDERGDLDFGVVGVPKKGEDVSGDGWFVHSDRGRHVLLVVDGLGHGPQAAMAARAAHEAIAARPERTAIEHVQEIHGALRSTRGAAAAVAVLSPSRQVGEFCGVGNINAVARAAQKSRSLVSHNGTLGHQVRKTQEFSFPLPARSLLIMHSDGLTTHWDLGRYPGLDLRHPALIAAVLFRDFDRHTDDATVLVARSVQAGPA